jgi:hypothetical protein
MINIITGTKGTNKGKTIQVSKDPKIGFVTVQSETDVLRNGWFDTKKLTTNVRGPIEKLQKIGDWQDYVQGGKIIVVESLTPINSSDKSQGLKLAGETGVVCMKDGSPIYRQTEFTKEPSAHNVYIQHTNIDEIRKANGIETKAVALEDYVKQQA